MMFDAAAVETAVTVHSQVEPAAEPTVVEAEAPVSAPVTAPVTSDTNTPAVEAGEADGADEAVQVAGTDDHSTDESTADEEQTASDTIADDASAQAAPESTSDASVDDAEQDIAQIPEALTSAVPGQEVVFVVDNLPDLDTLTSGVREGVEVVMLDSQGDGLAQMAEYLDGRTGLSAIHIVSHGDEGAVQLGNLWLTSDNVASHGSLLASIGASLAADGDILLYGCNIGADEDGLRLLQNVAELTSADVAASDDATGSAVLGGNWMLERTTGEIESASLNPAAFGNLLATGTLVFTGSPNSTTAEDGVASNDIAGISLTITNDINANWTLETPYNQTGIAADYGNNTSSGQVTISGSTAFHLESIFLADYGGNGLITLSGYLNGVPSGSVTVNVDGVWENTFDESNGLDPAIFGNVDEVRITAPSGDLWVVLNNIEIADAIVPNATPTIANLNGDSVAWAGVGNTVVLDASGNATLSDAELGALNGGNGNWAGASLTIQRPGTAVGADTLGFNTSGALFTVSGSNLQSGGQTFATFTNTGGVLTINFTSSGTTATTALVNDVAQRITYRSDTPAGDATLRYTLSDGTANSAADVTVTSDTIYVTNTTDTATINVSNGVSFSEAVAIAAADATGSQTVVFDSALAGQTLNLGSVSLNESLTFDMDQASGLVLTGGTITLGGGTTQTFTHGSGDSASISSLIAGSGGLTKAGAGNLTLSGAGNTFSGATTISAGTLTVSGGDALASNTSVSVSAGATLALAGNEAIGNLSGAGPVTLGSFSLTSNQTADTTFSGNISGTGGLNINQTGSATYSTTLSGTNTYTGNTILLNYGWLRLNGDASMSDSGAVRVNGNSVLTLLSNQTIGSLASSSASASIQLGSYTLSAGGDNTSTLVSGAVSGTGSLVKQGSGTMTLAGSNTYSGTTTVSAGTLSIAGDGNLGSGSVTLAEATVLEVTGATTIDNAIVLSGNGSVSNANAVTLSGVISGSYDLTKTDSGTLSLSGSNSYGATHVNAGTLSITNDGNLGTGAVNLAAGTTLALTGANIIDNAIALGGNASVSSSAAATLSGVISGGFTLTKTGASSLTLSGSNTYGATTVSAGTLSVASDSNLGSGALTLAAGSTLAVTSATTIDNAVALNGNATVNTAADTTLSGVISGASNLTKTGAASLTLSGSNTYSGTTTVSAGTLSIASDANLGAGSVNLANGTTLQITGSTTIDNAIVLTGVATVNAGAATTLSGTVSGTGGLTKTGAATLTLSGANTNTGGTSVSAGTLAVDGSTNSATTVASGATLAGSGILGGDVTVQNGGTLAPGNAGAGNLTVNGNLTMNAGSTLALDINGATAGTGYDRVVVNGAVDVSGATLAVNHGYTAGNGETYAVVVNDAADAITGTFSGVGEGGAFNASGNGTELTASYIGGSGNDFTLTAPIAPVVTSVSSSTADGTYKIGDTITITVQFDSAVNVTGTPTLTLETGATDRVLNYVSGSGSNTLSFSYTVQAGDSSADLDYLSTSALSLNGGTIRDGNNQSALLELPTPGAAGSLGANAALVVDGVRPAATSIILSDSTLSIGETATVTITFNEAVLGLDVGDFTVANGTLSSPISSNGGLTWTATFTPSANITDASNIITFNNSGVMDQAGNIGSGSTDSGNYAIDTQRPTATIVVSDSALAAGETATVTITFSEAVTGLAIADFTVANGTLSNLSTSDNITYTATLTPSANVTDATNLITLDNTGVQDVAGNPGSGTTDSNNYAVDTQLPTASIVVSDTSLTVGETATVTITFSEAVSGLNTADFTVANGSLSGLSSSDGGVTWIATLTPSTDVEDTTNLITLDNTGYTDAAGNSGTGATDSNNYAIDTRAPAVTSVTVPANGTYVAGQTLAFTVNFDDTVTVDTSGGTPRIAVTLNTGGTVYAEYVSGSGSTALVFRLTVADGQLDSDGIAVGGSLAANGGTLLDGAGNAVTPTLNGVGTTTGVLVDALAPAGSSFVLQGNPASDASSVTFVLRLTEPVSGLDLADFQLSTTGSATGTLTGIQAQDGQTYLITVSDIRGQGSLGVVLSAGGSGVQDAVGNPMVADVASASHVVAPVAAPRPAPAPDAPSPLPTPDPVPPGPSVVPVAPPPPVAPLPAGGGMTPVPLFAPTPFIVSNALQAWSGGDGVAASALPGLAPAGIAGVLGPTTLDQLTDTGWDRHEQPWSVPVQSSNLAAAASAGLPMLGGQDAVVLRPGQPIEYVLPLGALVGDDLMRRSAVLVEVRQADGRPLPAWLRFDPATGRFSGVPPAGFSGRLSLEVSVQDGQGERRTLMVEFAVQGGRADAGPRDPAPQPPLSWRSLDSQWTAHGSAALSSQAHALLNALRAPVSPS
ncbi:Ig-like domain-containing protein [Hydrogenophaga flava]|uniref:Ig-like domain-containing protein n=1 Tax=Hydrogenophaga flava TaxID=65657 RepID=UPI0008270C6F|nr:Ig-like domain-containing protein [Hydrogenophaga flava]